MKHRHFSLPALLAIVAMLLFPLARIPAVGAAQAAPTVTPSYEAATVLIPEYQAPNPSLTPAQQQSAIYKPHEVVIDQSRDLWISANERGENGQFRGGISIFATGTNALIANVVIENAQLPIVLPPGSALTPAGQDAYGRDVIYALPGAEGHARHPHGIDMDRTNGLVYLIIEHSGYRWNATRSDFLPAATTDDESGMLLVFDIANPAQPQIVTGYLLGHGAHELAVNDNNGMVFQGNHENSPGVIPPNWVDVFVAPGDETGSAYHFIDTGYYNAVQGIEVDETTNLVYGTTHVGEKMFVFDGAQLPQPNATPDVEKVSGENVILRTVDLRAPFDQQIPEAAQIWASITTGPGELPPVLHFHDLTVDPVHHTAYTTLHSIHHAEHTGLPGEIDPPETDEEAEFDEPEHYMGRWLAEYDYATQQVTYIDLSNGINILDVPNVESPSAAQYGLSPSGGFEHWFVHAHWVAVDPARNAILVTGEHTGNLGVVNMATRQLEQVVSITRHIPGTAPIDEAHVHGVQIDTRTGTAYVSDEGTEMSYESVTILNPYFDLATSDDAGGTTAGGGHYTPGVVATVTATPNEISVFAGWTVDGADAGWANPLTITMANDHAIVAHFIPKVFFVDVQQGDPGYQEIMELAARGIILGYGNGEFGRTDTALRAQMAALIVRSMDWDGESWTNDFTDRNGLAPALWQAIGTLQHYDVASGYGDGTFGPNDLVTRAQTIAFITRAMKAKGYWVDQPGAPMPYIGVPAAHVTDLATFYHYTQALGGIPEAPVGSDAWNAPATRGWFAQALWRALDSRFGADQIP